MKFQAIVFDFDYTLADSSRGVVKCVNRALHDLGLPQASSEAICHTIGLPLVDVFTKLVGQEYAAQSQEFVRLFKKYADEVMADLTVLYPTVDPTMRLLRQQGMKLGIVSTKFRYRIDSVLRRDHVRDWFDVIVGGEDVASHKPDPEGLCRAITSLQCSRAQALYVGDSVVDAETARRADVAFIAVLSGVTSRNEFKNYPVAGIVENLSELPNFGTSKNVKKT
jgi:phosphoglycolate phosphatase